MKYVRFNGQSLIEIVVAVGIIMVVLVGVSDLVTRSLSLSSFQQNKKEAEKIAQNQLDLARAERDANPSAFFLDQSPDACQDFDDTKFQCSISYGDSLGGGIQMTVNVEWIDGDKTITTTLSQFLADPTT